MNQLVSKLSSGRHPVEIMLRPARTLEAFQACVERGYVHVKFTDTLGGTELGVRLDREGTDLSAVDFAAGQGRISLRGSLTLDYVPVTCAALIDLPDLKGEGWLELSDSRSS